MTLEGWRKPIIRLQLKSQLKELLDESEIGE